MLRNPQRRLIGLKRVNLCQGEVDKVLPIYCRFALITSPDGVNKASNMGMGNFPFCIFKIMLAVWKNNMLQPFFPPKNSATTSCNHSILQKASAGWGPVVNGVIFQTKPNKKSVFGKFGFLEICT